MILNLDNCISNTESSFLSYIKVAHKLIKVLISAFPGATILIENESKFDPASKISAELIWDGFSGMDQIDRQVMLYLVKRDELTLQEFCMTDFIMTLTHAEKRR